MDRETATLALAVVTILAVLAAVYPIIPVNSEKFYEIGVLGPNQKIGGYPSVVTVGQRFLLYCYVGNHEGSPSYDQLLVKEGNSSTVVSNSTATDAPVILTRYLVLDNNQNTTFPITLSMQSPGAHQRLIFELWSFDANTSQFAYTGITAYIWVNVTAH